MARQLDKVPVYSNEEAWQIFWNKIEARPYRNVFITLMPEKIEVGQPIKAFQVILNNDEHPPKIRGPLLLFRTVLDEDTAPHLQSILTLLRKIFSMDDTEALAFMISTALTMEGWSRVVYDQSGVIMSSSDRSRDWTFDELVKASEEMCTWAEYLNVSDEQIKKMTTDKSVFSDDFHKKEYNWNERIHRMFENMSLKHILDVWANIGGEFVEFAKNQMDRNPGMRMYYESYPPSLISYTKIKLFYEFRGSHLQVPISIDAPEAVTTDSTPNNITTVEMEKWMHDANMPLEKKLDDILKMMTPENTSEMETVESDYIFRKVDTGWHIRFDGKDLHGIPDRKILKFICHLIENYQEQGDTSLGVESRFFHDICAGRNNPQKLYIDPGDDHAGHIGSELDNAGRFKAGWKDEGLSLTDKTYITGELGDLKKSRRMLIQHLRNIPEAQDKAYGNEDDIEIDSLDNESDDTKKAINEIDKEIKSLYNRDNEKDFNNIYRQRGSLIKYLKDNRSLKRFGIHLQSCIKSKSMAWKYEPVDEKISWEL